MIPLEVETLIVTVPIVTPPHEENPNIQAINVDRSAIKEQALCKGNGSELLIQSTLKYSV